MVSIQARLVAVLALCLFASTVGSLPSNKPRGDSPFALIDPSTLPTGGLPLPDQKARPKENEGGKPAADKPAQPAAQTAPKARRAPQNDHIRLGKRGYPGHTHRSNSRRNRPNNRYPKHHRHGHAKTYNRKPASHSPHERSKYSDGFSTRF